MYNFDFVKPSSIAEAAKLLGSDGAQALSGGQTLMPTMKQRLASPSDLVDLRHARALGPGRGPAHASRGGLDAHDQPMRLADIVAVGTSVVVVDVPSCGPRPSRPVPSMKASARPVRYAISAVIG